MQVPLPELYTYRTFIFTYTLDNTNEGRMKLTAQPSLQAAGVPQCAVWEHKGKRTHIHPKKDKLHKKFKIYTINLF